MHHRHAIAAFAFDDPQPAISLYDYAPVLRIRDRSGDWVLKQTGLAHSGGVAIADWLRALGRCGVNVVAPADRFTPNPRRLADDREWVVYPFVEGRAYRGGADQIADAGRLLGQMHGADPIEARGLKTYNRPVVRTAAWLEQHVATAVTAMQSHGVDPSRLELLVAERLARAAPLDGLPLAGCSFDFKASNLVFGGKPTLVDPDHAAFMPRLFDLAVAALLFHCDLSSAPDRLWTGAQWRIFLQAYTEEVTLAQVEVRSWPAVLELAWLDQAVWLLGNWPEGWADEKERHYLVDLATLDLARFSLSASA